MSSSIRDRIQQHQRERGVSTRQQTNGGEQLGETATPRLNTPGPSWGIVDGGEVVRIIGATSIPGMSLAYICANRSGENAPVSYTDVKIFPEPLTFEAIEALAQASQQQGTVRR